MRQDCVLGLAATLILWSPCTCSTVPSSGLLMPCPHCTSTVTRARAVHTQLGERTCRCPSCTRLFHARTGTPFTHLTLPSALVLQVGRWRLRSKRSVRDRAEMFLERGFTFPHAVVRTWEARFAPLLAQHLRSKRQGQVGRSW